MNSTELALFDQVEQPQGQRRRQIGFKPQPALVDLVAEPLGLFDGMGPVAGIGPFGPRYSARGGQAA